MGIIVRCAPSRVGIQVAGAWRIWSQGEEFYAAFRDQARLGKFSFHGIDKWQLRIGAMVQRLARPLRFGKWLHALQVSFLIEKEVMLPREQREADITMVETPLGHKFIFNILLSAEPTPHPLQPPRELAGKVLGTDRLRSGAWVMVVGRTRPFDQNDISKMDELRKQGIQINVEPPLREGAGAYAEISSCTFNAVTGNAMVVVPLAPEAFVRPSHNSDKN